MTRWFRLEAADDEFLRGAPYVYRHRIEHAGPPEEIWASLVSDESLSAWGRMVPALRWLTPRPFGVGTRREVTTLGGMTSREEFFCWEEGRRYAFAVYESNRPGVRRFAEDYVVSAHAGGSVLDWTVALEPQPAARPAMLVLNPLLKLAVGRTAADGRRYFAAAR